jgi:hypothetical protein
MTINAGQQPPKTFPLPLTQTPTELVTDVISFSADKTSINLGRSSLDADKVTVEESTTQSCIHRGGFAARLLPGNRGQTQKRPNALFRTHAAVRCALNQLAQQIGVVGENLGGAGDWGSCPDLPISRWLPKLSPFLIQTGD